MKERLNSPLAQEVVHQILALSKRLYARNLLAGCDGNLSFRMENYVIITPSQIPKISLEAKDFALMNLAGECLHGNPSSESKMHLHIYRQCPKARAVIHAHPPHAIAWTVAKPNLNKLPTDGLSEVILAMDEIPIASFAMPGTEALSNSLTPFLPQYRAIIMARHGAVSWGEDLNEAMNGMERIEHVSQILMLAEQLGGATPLDEKSLAQLQQLRAKIGDKIL